MSLNLHLLVILIFYLPCVNVLIFFHSDLIVDLWSLLENLIRGLDGDETVFLDLVTKQQEEIANRRFNEESQELREYRVKMKCRDMIVL